MPVTWYALLRAGGEQGDAPDEAQGGRALITRVAPWLSLLNCKAKDVERTAAQG